MSTLELSPCDEALLAGNEGAARQLAMKIMVRMAALQGASRFIDITRAHIDGCIYTGAGSIRFAETLADHGGRVAVPTSMNVISLDRQRWRAQGVDPAWAEGADRVARAYVRMGARQTFTCAPYQTLDPPAFGEHIAWAESNAISYANAVLGARTNRYGDFMDICAALTGRAPLAGYHLDEARLGSLLVELPALGPLDASFYPVLGYLIGGRAGASVPVIAGLAATPSSDDLKAFAAAAATSGAVAMFHVVGVTPEAPTLRAAFGGRSPQERWCMSRDELAAAWRELSTVRDGRVDMIVLGSPHFSLGECRALATLAGDSHCHPGVEMLITTSHFVYKAARRTGVAEQVERFGGRFVTDTCILNSPIIPEASRTLMTNSAKYAHYAPGLLGRDIYFGSLADCVRSAVAGRPLISDPAWLYPTAHVPSTDRPVASASAHALGDEARP